MGTTLILALFLAAGAAEPTVAEDPSPPTLTGPRDLWALLGVDESHFEHLTDNGPWQESEDEVLRKMLFRAPDFQPQEVERWARDAFPPNDEATSDLRGEIFRLRGQAVLVEAIRMPERYRQLYQFDSYYRCQFILEDGRPAVVFARTVPHAWKRGEPIDHRGGAFGFFLKFAGEDGRSEPNFVARRVAWYPHTPLGDLGMDVGLFDDLRPGPLTARSRECFYQLLAAVERAEPGRLLGQAQAELRQSGASQVSVVPLFNEPATQRGRLVVLSGTAREVVLIRVDDEDVRSRFGIDHYYQISLFTDDSQGNPLVFCVREIPPDMPTGKGPGFGEYVTAAGFFFNSWAYRSQVPTEAPDAGPQVQLAPLLIGRSVVWQPTEPPAKNPIVGAIAAGVFALVLLIIWIVLWRHSRGDKRFSDQTLDRHRGGKPDLSGLDKPPGSDPPAPAS